MATSTAVHRAPNRGRFTPTRAAAMAKRGAAVRRHRRDTTRAAILEARAGALLTQAAELRRQATEDLATAGVLGV